MARPRTQEIGRQTLAGTARIFLADALILPTGLITVAFLTRRLGTDGYGLLSLASVLIAWVEWTVVSLFARATIRLIGESRAWKPLATRVLQLNLAVSLTVTAGLWLVAPAVAAGLDEPRLAFFLRLFALDIPLFVLAYTHGNIITGIGEYALRAQGIAARWLARLILVVVFVSLGLSVKGAILGSIGASLVELLVVRRYDRPRLFERARAPTRVLYAYALPLFLYTLSLTIYHKVDLFALKALRSTTAEVGLYAAAQNMSLVPGLFAAAFTPLLLSTLSRLIRDEARDHARDMGRDSLRLALLLLPFAAMTAGASGEIVRFLFGAPFGPAGPLVALLIFAGVAAVMTSVATTILTAGSKPSWPLRLVGPLVPLSILGHLGAIPRWGGMGAAAVTTVAAFLGAAATLGAVHRLWGILPPASTLWRSAAIGLGAYASAVLWPAVSWLLVVKISLISGAIPMAYWLLGEFSQRELELARSLLRRQTAPTASSEVA